MPVKKISDDHVYAVLRDRAPRLEHMQLAIGLLQRFEPPLVIRIVSAGYEFDSLDELVEMRGVSPGKVEIEAEQKELGRPFARASFTFSAGMIKVSTTSASIGHQFLEAIAGEASSIKSGLLETWRWITATFVLLFASYGLSHLGPDWKPAARITAIAAVATMVVSGLVMSIRDAALAVNLTPRHRGFWRRNSDKIVVGAITGIMGAVAGSAITVSLQGLADEEPKAEATTTQPIQDEPRR